jgi:hypothetical protein
LDGFESAEVRFEHLLVEGHQESILGGTVMVADRVNQLLFAHGGFS